MAEAMFNEKELFEKYNSCYDKKLRDEIIEHYIYIPEILSKRFSGKGLEYEDIYQVACLGLVLAVERFDTSKNVKFATFATPTVLGEIKKHFRDKGYFVLSLEQEAFVDGETALLDVIGKEDDSLIMIENADMIDSALSALEEKEREFVRLRYYEECTQKQIADKWNVSQMQVSRYEKRILEKLRAILK